MRETLLLCCFKQREGYFTVGCIRLSGFSFLFLSICACNQNQRKRQRPRALRSQTHWYQLNPLSSSSCRVVGVVGNCRVEHEQPRVHLLLLLLVRPSHTFRAAHSLSQHDALAEAVGTSTSSSSSSKRIGNQAPGRAQASFRLSFFRILVHRSQRKWSHHGARFSYTDRTINDSFFARALKNN